MKRWGLGSFDTTVRIWDTKLALSLSLSFSFLTNPPLHNRVRSNNKLPIQILDDARDSITSLLIRDSTITTGCVDGYLRTYDLRMGMITKDFFDRNLHFRSSFFFLLPLTPFESGLEPITSLSASKNTPSLILLSVLSVPSSHPSQPAQKAAHHLLDTSNGTVLQSYTGHSNENYRIKSCFAGGNEEFVLGGDEDGVIRYWDTESVCFLLFLLFVWAEWGT